MPSQCNGDNSLYCHVTEPKTTLEASLICSQGINATSSSLKFTDDLLINNLTDKHKNEAPDAFYVNAENQCVSLAGGVFDCCGSSNQSSFFCSYEKNSFNLTSSCMASTAAGSSAGLSPSIILVFVISATIFGVALLTMCKGKEAVTAVEANTNRNSTITDGRSKRSVSLDTLSHNPRKVSSEHDTALGRSVELVFCHISQPRQGT